MSERAPRKLAADALWDYGLRLLSGRAHSIGELRQKLERRAERQEDVPPVLERLKDLKYLDDRRYAELFSQSRLEGEGLGRIRVLSDLRKRRVAPKLAEQAVEEAYAGTDEVRLIEDYLRRKYRKLPLETVFEEPKNLASAYRRLRAAGFKGSNVLRVLRRLAKQPEFLDSLEGDEPSRE